MPSLAYTHMRVRARSRDRTPSPPPLAHRTSFKRPRLIRSHSSSSSSSSSSDKRPAPSSSRLERWGIWTNPHRPSHSPPPALPAATGRHDSGGPESPPPRVRRRVRRVSFAGVDDERGGLDELDCFDEERAFRHRVASLSSSRRRFVSPPPRRCSPPPLPSRAHRCCPDSDDERVRSRAWSVELRRRRERCVSEEVEARERERCCEVERERERLRERRERDWCESDEEWDSGWETEGERVVRWRRVTRTRTGMDVRRPLGGWRRA
ncbi:hypothetical protein E8E13_009382 [Curvularia kusanoi]|uniref:Uncharacterized protein n=1 Tax=Curvularia kusanoi TaxID=90978 RepID=A0A9P4W9Q3_CURKU|nr:hypothetical protein E8E13_009382 [Curvularia kusanoi]